MDGWIDIFVVMFYFGTFLNMIRRKLSPISWWSNIDRCLPGPNNQSIGIWYAGNEAQQSTMLYIIPLKQQKVDASVDNQDYFYWKQKEMKYEECNAN